VTTTRSPEFLVGLVRARCTLANETGWVEFKENSDRPEEIGELLSLAQTNCDPAR
jgi:hypothetical protein